MTCEYVIERDASLDEIAVFAPVLTLLSVFVGPDVGGMCADEIGADLPFLRIIRIMTEEDKDGIVGTEFVFRAYNPGVPFVAAESGSRSSRHA